MFVRQQTRLTASKRRLQCTEGIRIEPKDSFFGELREEIACLSVCTCQLIELDVFQRFSGGDFPETTRRGLVGS